MAALEARSLLTGETIPSPDALYPTGVGGIVRMVGGLRLERWGPSAQNGGRLQIGRGGRLTLESALRLGRVPDAGCWRMGARSLRRTRDHAGGRTVGETDGASVAAC